MSKKNIDIKEHKSIFFIGIGGVGLSALASIMLKKGYDVYGSDLNESVLLSNLIKQGAKIYLGHNKKHIKNIDLVVYSNAISNDNPEYLEAKAQKIKMITRSTLLGILMDNANNSVAVTGTHGKTTTTAIVSNVLIEAKEDPTVLIGGILDSIKGNVLIGKNEYFVTEACEYMNSFLDLRPKYAIILNIEADHLDYFSDIQEITKSFQKFSENIQKDGSLIVYDANPHISTIINKSKKKVVTFGYSLGSDYRATDISFNNKGCAQFKVYKHQEKLLQIQLKLTGEHNVLNALASIALLDTMGIDKVTIKKVIAKFTGVKRRFDIKGMTDTGVKVIDDYAHHPTEIDVTLKAIKNINHKKLWCIFQPHTYTRTLALYEDFANVLQKNADVIIFAKIYPAREVNIKNITSEIILNEMPKSLVKQNKAFYIEDFNDIAEYVYNNAKKGDIVITLGAGSITELGDIILNYNTAAPETIIKAVKIKD